MSDIDHYLLAHIFSIPAKGKKKRKAKTEYEFSGRKCHVEKRGSEWEGWFPDKQGVTYVADTKGELLADMESCAMCK